MYPHDTSRTRPRQPSTRSGRIMTPKPYAAGHLASPAAGHGCDARLITTPLWRHSAACHGSLSARTAFLKRGQQQPSVTDTSNRLAVTRESCQIKHARAGKPSAATMVTWDNCKGEFFQVKRRCRVCSKLQSRSPQFNPIHVKMEQHQTYASIFIIVSHRTILETDGRGGGENPIQRPS